MVGNATSARAVESAGVVPRRSASRQRRRKCCVAFLARILESDERPASSCLQIGEQRRNDRNQRLLLDTGASGILINRRAAEKAGLTKISAVQFGGIGDKGHRDAYLAVAENIRIGDLSFKDCVVTVSEKSLGMDEDGVIGADVFSSYLVDIDIPGDTLRLSPLPRRPDEMDAKLSLATEEDSDRYPTSKARP